VIPARATLGPEPIRVAVPPMLAASATLSVSAALNRLNSALGTQTCTLKVTAYIGHRKNRGLIYKISYDNLTIILR